MAMRISGYVWFILCLSLCKGAWVLANKSQVTIEDAVHLTFGDPRVQKRQFFENTLVEFGKDSEKGIWLKFWREGKAPEELTSATLVSILTSSQPFSNLQSSELMAPLISKDLTKLVVNVRNDYYLIHLLESRAQRLTEDGKKKELASFSAGNRYLIYFSQNVLWSVSLEGKTLSAPLMQVEGEVFCGKLDWVYQEEVYGRGTYQGYALSPIGDEIAFLRFDESGVPRYPLVNFDVRYGDLDLYSYPKAGDQLPKVQLGLTSFPGGEVQYLQFDRPLEDTIISAFSWSPDGRCLIVQLHNRSQNHSELWQYDKNRGLTLIDEEDSSTWVLRMQEEPHWYMNQGQPGFYWLSERSGIAAIHSFVWDQKSSVFKEEKKIDLGQINIKEVLFADASKVYIRAHPENVWEDQIIQVDTKSAGQHLLSDKNCDSAARFSKDGLKALVSCSMFSAPPKVELVRVGEQGFDAIASIFAPDLSRLEEKELLPHRFLQVPVSDGQMIEVVYIAPKLKNPHEKAPLLVHTYAGPHTARARNQWSGFYLWHQFLAQQGYAVAIIDPRSSQSIGRAGGDLSHRQFGVQELKDIEEAVTVLLQRLPLDASRVGIWGWSFGGFMSAYALAHSNVFKAAVAVAAVTDWSLYDAIYTERYMDLPSENPAGYQKTSLVANADLFKKPLLLIHGCMDDNVHYQHAVQLADAINRAGGPVEFVTFGKSDHRLNEFLQPLFTRFFRFLDVSL